MSDSIEKVKVALLGESGVGKTIIVFQFCDGIFYPNCEITDNIDYFSKIIDLPIINKTIKFSIFDTSEKEKSRDLIKINYQHAYIFILVYDITSNKSFLF